MPRCRSKLYANSGAWGWGKIRPDIDLTSPGVWASKKGFKAPMFQTKTGEWFCKRPGRWGWKGKEKTTQQKYSWMLVEDGRNVEPKGTWHTFQGGKANNNLQRKTVSLFFLAWIYITWYQMARERTCVYEEIAKPPGDGIFMCRSSSEAPRKSWHFLECLFEMLDVGKSQNWGRSKSLQSVHFSRKVIDFRAHKVWF